MGSEVKYDPDKVDNGKGRIGYKGPYPRTPCPKCGNEYFTWDGDWNMGYSCAKCNAHWQLENAKFRYALWQDRSGNWHVNGMGVVL